MVADDYKEAWAVADEDGVNVRTITDSRRGAIVNWLCDVQDTMLTRLASDAVIEELWARLRDNAIVCKVHVYVAR